MDQHEEQEHDVYGSEIPDEGEIDADIDMSSRPEEDEDHGPNSKDLEDMKKRLKEIEEEAGALREMQAKVEKEMGAVQDSSSASATQAEKEEVDSRSIYVGNVDYTCTPEEVQQHFQSCGTVNRVTILTDKFGQPKGFAYVEFVETDAVQNALLLNESELHGRQLKVSAKRTNIPGMKQYRGRRPNPYGFRSRRPFMPAPPFYPPYGYGCCLCFFLFHFARCCLFLVVAAMEHAGPLPKHFGMPEYLVLVCKYQFVVRRGCSELEGFQGSGDQCVTDHINEQ
ncbi:polyadenylate-binding protein 1 isoform X2 [Hevea brasiliensis]|uniref:polyadenylate-binding protein 1 isoform X2 n=1 Tax=Hevea brasiliensis TaxID=3981 RepID=UPI000B775B00|nr:polyadenylate-binding protein 1 isoform X2 [Hevea brasiliensis]